MTSEWYQNAVFYTIDTETFADSDGDGVGDFRGLTGALDYLEWLGVNALWLLPFYPSPQRDNGYDVADYYGIDPRLGTPGDFAEFLRQAQRRGIHILADLVINHTSSDHPWFKASEEGRPRYRDYYLWTRDPSKEPDYRPMFPGVQKGVWQFDERAGAYYLHHFYNHEPDLNTAHPAVRDEIERIIGYWLQLGVSGFRIDAAPFLRSVASEDKQNPHPLLRHLRAFASERAPDAVLLGECDVPPDDLADFFGGGDELEMLYNFLLAQYLFLAFAREQAEPLARVLRLLPAAPPGCTWLSFLRNLDELNLAKLDEQEQEDTFAAFAPEPEMRIFGRGIRRRLAPMLGGDRRRLELAYSLLFSLPGASLVVYGDEIGMGDNLQLAERNPVRTPMQWSAEPNAGFSAAPAEDLLRPVIADGPFSYQRVNVANQQQDPASFLSWMRHLVRVRRACPEIGLGSLEVLASESPAVFAHRLSGLSGEVVAIHNLSREEQGITLDLAAAVATTVLGAQEGEDVAANPLRLTLPGYGYRWLRPNRPTGAR